MSRGEHLTDFEAERIAALAKKGLAPAQIVKETGRSRYSVWRVLNGRRSLPVWRKGDAEEHAENSLFLATSLPLRLATRISSAVSSEEAGMATAEMIRTNFIDALTPHFKVRVEGQDRFFADLASALIDEQFSPVVLQHAAKMFIRSRTSSNFPAVAACIRACRFARTELGVDAKSTPAGADADAQSMPHGRNTDSRREVAA